MNERPEHIPAHWEAASVEELTEFVTSGSRGWAKYYSDDGPLFLRVGNLNHDTVYIDLSNIVHVIPPEGAEGKRTSVLPDDILLSITAEVGMVGLAREGLGEAYVNQHVALLRPLPSIWSPGLAYSFLDPQGLQALARKGQYGATKPGLSLIQVRSFQVGVPPLPEQHRIVEAIESYFTRLDDAERTLKRVQRNLKRYRASVLMAAVEGRLVPTEAELAQAEGRDYEPASVLLERILSERRRRWEEAELASLKAKGKPPKNDKWKAKYKEPVPPDTTDLPELPEGWCWASVGRLASHAPNSLTDGPFGSNLKTAHYTSTGPRVVRLQNIGEGEFLNAEAHISQEHYDGLTKHAVRPGDLIVASLGEVLPRVCMVPCWLGPAIVKADCLRLETHSALVAARYAMHALNSPNTRSATEEIVHGVGRPRIGLTLFREVPVPIPPRSEQDRIVEAIEMHLSLAANAISVVTNNEARCTRLRQAVLKWAFEGELADQDPNDEPASVLLDRIRTERKATEERKRGRPRKEGRNTI